MSESDQLITLYRRPGSVQGGTWSFDGEQIACLIVDGMANELMESVFETVIERLLNDLEIEAEPDGSFVVAGGERKQRWEIAGMMYDGGEQLAYVELQGNGPQAIWETLLVALIDEASVQSLQRYMIFLRCEGRFLSVETFLERFTL